MPKSRLSAEQLAKILHDMESQHGTLTPEAIVEEARAADHELHKEFEWNDAIAGQQCRIDQARALIRRVRITMVVEHQTISAPAYVHNPASANQEYVAVRNVRRDEDQARDVLIAEFRAAGSHLRRARDLAVYFGRAGEVSEILDRLGIVQEAFATGGAA